MSIPASRFAASLFMLFAVFASPALAQQQDPPRPPVVPPGTPASTGAASDSAASAIRLLAKGTEGGVILRWAPTTPRVWSFTNDVGYVVERFAPGEGGPDEATLDSLRRNAPPPDDSDDVDEAAVVDILENIDPEAEIDPDDVARRLREAGVPPADAAELAAEVAAGPDESALEMDFQPLTPGVLRPWTVQEWSERVDPRDPADRYAAVAAQMLRGESAVPATAGPFERINDGVSELENRFGFSLVAADLNAEAARGLALRYTDEDADPSAGGPYVYRVYPAEQPEAFAIDTAYVLVGPRSLRPDRPVPSVAVDVNEERTQLAWPRSMPGGNSYTAYYVERADGRRDSLYTPGTALGDLGDLDPQDLVAGGPDGGGFTRLTDLPYLPVENQNLSTGGAALYNDTTAVATEVYTYRLYGITPFATLSLPAQITAPARDLTAPPSPDIVDKGQIEGATVRLAWEMPAVPDDLEGFELGISNDAQGPFEVDRARGLLPPTAREATDSRAISNTMNYYTITAVDTAGNRTRSAPNYVHLVDSLPPAAPAGLAARADTNGLVTLTWEPSEAPDIDGYRIFQANSEEEGLILDTGEAHQDTAYVDTVALETLTKNSYYAVEAVDRNFNISEKTRIHVELPDVVPPVAPVITAATPTSQSVRLAWTPSVSDDVAHHIVLRRVATSSEVEGSEAPPDWEEQEVLSATAATFVDEAVEQKREYAYLVVAEDEAGLRSEGGRPVAARPYDTGLLPRVEGLRAEAEDGTVRLRWHYAAPEGAGEHRFVVYRAVQTEAGEDARMQRYRSAEETTFEDPAAREGRAYQYAVQVVSASGGQSRLSNIVRAALEAE